MQARACLDAYLKLLAAEALDLAEPEARVIIQAVLAIVDDLARIQHLG